MGSSQTDWTTPTLFVMSKMSIIYGDPLMVTEDDLRRKSDVLTILKSAINRFAKDEANLIAMDIPPKPSTEQEEYTSIETSIARKITSDLSLSQLSDYLAD